MLMKTLRRKPVWRVTALEQVETTGKCSEPKDGCQAYRDASRLKANGVSDQGANLLSRSY